MEQVIKIVFLIPFLVLCFQLYAFSVSRDGVEKQHRCQWLGIIFMTAGTVALVFHSPLSGFTGIFLLMLGFKLLAKGLDRIDKKIFIDRFDNNR